MRNLFWIFFSAVTLFVLSPSVAAAGQAFDDNFTDATMRIDYFRTGNAKSETLTIDKIYKYGTWAGSESNLIDTSDLGRNYVHIKDAATGKILFSKGFDSLFGEYQSTDAAIKGQNRTFSESILIPFPKNKVTFLFLQRDKKNNLKKFFETTIDPQDVSIVSESMADPSVKVIKAHSGANQHEAVDVAVLGEGFTKKELGKFKKDLKRFTNTFLSEEPMASNKNNFNIYGVFKPSEESGSDEPTAGIFKKTSLNASFNTLGSERYLMAEDNKTMRDVASHVPYDAIIIMVNHKRYGGGGIYNQHATYTTDSPWVDYVVVHEFGHSFGGLADEYYTSSVSFNDFYPKGVEPKEPNITALINPKKLKWEATEGVAVPTVWEKADFDTMDLAWQAERRKLVGRTDELKKARASKDEIEKSESEYNTKDKEHNVKVHEYLDKSKYAGKVGAFEGAGYASKGLYRPQLDCRMFSKGTTPFCKVCLDAMRRTIAHYSQK